MNREAKHLILEDRLLHSSSETVSTWLEQANGNVYENRYSRDYDEEIESALLNVGNPLVELAVAQYGTNQDALAKLWVRTEQSPDKHIGHIRALRLAILANQNVGVSLSFGTSLITVIGIDAFPAFVEQASDEELNAMGQNPRLAFFEALYEKTGSFESLSDERWRQVITATTGNSRLLEKFKDRDDRDGYREYHHNCVHSAIYKLPARVPVTQEWAITLAWLLEKTLPELPFKTTVEDIDATMARWRAPLFEKPADDKFHIDPCAFLRTYYGRLYFSYSIKKPIEMLLTSDDQATRCVAYAWCELTPEQIKAGAEKDKDEFLFWACSNKNLCQSEIVRDSVREVARTFGDDEGHEIQRFAYICAEQRKEKPYWFKDDPYADEPDPYDVQDSEQQPALAGPEIMSLIGKVDKIFSKVETVYAIAIGFVIFAILRSIFH